MIKELINMKKKIKIYDNQNIKLNQKIKQLKLELQIKNTELEQIENKILISKQKHNSLNIITNNQKKNNYHNYKTFSKDNISNFSVSSNNNSNKYLSINSKNKKRPKSQSSNSSLCSQLYNQSISRINEDKKVPLERLKVQEKLDEYKKIIDKKLNDTRNKNTNLLKSNHNKSCSNITSKEKSLEKEISVIQKKGLSHRVTDNNLIIIKGSDKKNNVNNINKKKIINKSMIILKNSISSKTNCNNKGKLMKKKDILPIENKENLSNNNFNNINISNNNISTMNNNISSKQNITLRQFIFSKCSTSTTNRTQSKN